MYDESEEIAIVVLVLRLQQDDTALHVLGLNLQTSLLD